MSKFTCYAVRKGKQTGIYGTWAECETQIKGYINAEFKGFATREDAEHYMNGTRPALQNGMYHIFVDGSCLGNPGRGAIAFSVYRGNYLLHKEAKNGWSSTTNNRMELEAVLHAMRWVWFRLEHDSQIILHTDSNYMINALRGCGSSNGDLLDKIREIPKHFLNLKVLHMRGHVGSYYSDEVDKLAKQAADQQ